MNITVLGAAGKTGADVVTKALERGHQVTAFVRDPAGFSISHPALTVVSGDAREAADLAKAFVGADAVISTLGSMKAGDELIARSSRALVEAATQTGLGRVVVMSSFLAAPNYKPNLAGRLMAPMVRGMVGDKTAGEAVITRSDLTWTIVYPTQLDKVPAGRPVRVVGAGETVSMGNGIARADVADFLLDEVTTGAHPRDTVVITAA